MSTPISTAPMADTATSTATTAADAAIGTASAAAPAYIDPYQAPPAEASPAWLGGPQAVTHDVTAPGDGLVAAAHAASQGAPQGTAGADSGAHAVANWFDGGLPVQACVPRVGAGGPPLPGADLVRAEAHAPLAPAVPEPLDGLLLAVRLERDGHERQSRGVWCGDLADCRDGA